MNTALLVIDYINGIMNGSCRDYASKYPIIANANKLIDICRQQEIPIYFIRLAFDEHYIDLPKYSKSFNLIKNKGLFKLGTNDVKFVTELDYQSKDIIINKTAVSPFHSIGLNEALKNDNIERLIFAGVATDNAINLGVREAHDMGYYTIIAEDACGASSEEFHHWSIALLTKIANDILTTEEIAHML